MVNMVKTITIRTEVYDNLVHTKKKEESFSELLERLLSAVSPIEVLSNLRGSMTFKNKKRMLAEIYSKRSERRT